MKVLTIRTFFVKIHTIRYVSSCAESTSMTGSVRFPVEILVKTSYRDKKSILYCTICICAKFMRQSALSLAKQVVISYNKI